jgi:hypothetical protein
MSLAPPARDSVKAGTGVHFGCARRTEVPTNARALVTFRRHVEQAWHRQLQRRSQRARWGVEKINPDNWGADK